MLDKTERRYLTGQTKEEVVDKVHAILGDNGIPVAPTGPQSWAGTGQRASWGVLPTVAVSVTAAEGGHTVDVSVGADLQQSAIVIVAVALVLVFPVGILLGLLGYLDFQKRQGLLLQNVWSALGAPTVAPGAPPPHAGASPPGPSPSPPAGA